MPSVEEVEKQIEEVEEFQALFCSPDGSDIDQQQVDPYPYVNAANKKWTVLKWANTRFAPIYGEFYVGVFDGDGNLVEADTSLSTVRDSYYEAEGNLQMEDETLFVTSAHEPDNAQGEPESGLWVIADVLVTGDFNLSDPGEGLSEVL